MKKNINKKMILLVFSITALSFLIPLSSGSYFVCDIDGTGEHRTQRLTVFWFTKLDIDMTVEAEVWSGTAGYYLIDCQGSYTSDVDNDYTWDEEAEYYSYDTDGGRRVVFHYHVNGKFYLTTDEVNEYIDIDITLSMEINEDMTISSTWSKHMATGTWQKTESTS